jgi:hypothetical protein
LSVAKKRCKYCKEYFAKYIKVPAGVFCNIDHAIQYVNSQREKKQRKENYKEKRSYQLKDIDIREEAAKKWCHRYIRKRDKGKPCICCGRPWAEGDHAGHFFESGNNPAIRFNEDNIHSQKEYCNFYKGGDSGDYERNLIKKIGIVRVESLRSQKGALGFKPTPEYYLEIEQYYKQKLRYLQNED